MGEMSYTNYGGCVDTVNKQKRSQIMSAIKGCNTKPELIVRSFLHKNGLRFRLHDKSLPGCPDIVLKKHKSIVFVHGCFWHIHTSKTCKISHFPKSNTAFWKNKLDKNVLRDKKNISSLTELGWHIFIIWECESKQERALKELVAKIKYNKA